jgi:hypothetical protein
MNKEFKKLLEASYTKGFEECARTGHKVGQLDAIFNSIVMGEFAELIVRECAEMLACEYGQSATSGNEAAIFIRNHFGVKE